MSSSAGSDSELRPNGLLNALEDLEAVAFVPSRQRHTDVGQLAKIIADDAYDGGIPKAALDRLVNILTTPNQLDQSTITTFIKNMYPQERIQPEVVTKIVGCLGPSKNKPSAATQALLLRWLIMAYDFLEDSTHLLKFYAVLFNHLDMISLRKSLCHLLALLTRRKHVKPFRIQALMELLRNAGGDEKELVGLLRVFKNYYPDIIVGNLGISRRAGLFFKHPDPEWTSHVKSIQDKDAERSRAAATGSSFQVVRRGIVKRSKMEVIVPDVQTSRVSQNHTSLEELRSVGDFVEKLERIEPPNQMISILGDNLAQKYLLLVQPEMANRRLQDWLESFLDDKLEHIQDGDEEEPETLTYILTLAVEYVRHTKEIPDAVVSFIGKYLLAWNGKENRGQIMNILEYLPIDSFDTVRTSFLQPLEAAVLDGTLSSRTALLDFYAALIRQWGIKLRLHPSSSGESKPLSQLMVHAELLASSIIENSPATHDDASHQSKPAYLSVLEFYSTLAELFSHASTNGKIRLTIPLAPTVYTLALTPTNAVISILSSVLATYKSSFEASLTSPVLQVPNPPESLYPTNLVGEFNGYVMDICNLVWRNRALNSEDPNAVGCLIPSSTVSVLSQYVRDTCELARERRREDAFFYTIASAFSLSHHAALCNLSAACFAGIEEEKEIRDDQPRLRKPVTQKALSALEKEGGIKMTWQEYRVQMLDWLDSIGSQGIGNLMRSTMKALRKEG